VLQHVTIEVRRADVDACVAFWELLGFERLSAPSGLVDIATWVGRDGRHVHFLYTESPVVPPLAHAAVVVDDYDAALAAIRDAGHEVREQAQYWDGRRAFAHMPTGHVVEIMETAPPSDPA
jgi:glyoxylase I family protein